ncbi:MAG TPA: Ig-like domain-containing protein [Spirochaetota bacterium]|nr:Ig-like domain-containing protein [Spirochaetota bacterium]
MKRLYKITRGMISCSTRKAGKLSIVHRLSIIAVIIAALTFTFCEDIMEQVKEYNEMFEVVSVDPANNASNVPYTAVITVTFSNDVDMSTVSSSTFKVNDGAVTGTFSYDPVSRAVTFTPASEFLHSTVYSVNITQGVYSIDGKPLESAYSGSFTTEIYYFYVVSVSPAAGGVDVPVSSNIVVQFDDNIDLSTVTTSTFIVDGGAGAIAGAYTIDALLRTVTFNPSSDMAGFTNYNVTLTTGIQNLTSETMATDYFWGFTTASGLVPEIYIESPLGAEIASGGSFDAGSLITPYTFTIFNTGSGSLTINSFSLDNAEFSVSAAGTPYSIGAGGNSTFNVTFTPSSIGVKNTVLTINNTDSDEASFIINLTGYSPVTPSAEIQVTDNGIILVSPNSTVDFGTITIGATGTDTIVIHNIGTANLVISGTTLGGTNPALFNTGFTTATIVPGATANVVITFSAPIKINAKATITFSNNDSDEGSFVVKLKGRTMP